MYVFLEKVTILTLPGHYQEIKVKDFTRFALDRKQIINLVGKYMCYGSISFLSLNFIFLCLILIIIHYHTQKQRKIKFEPRKKLNHNMCTVRFMVVDL